MTIESASKEQYFYLAVILYESTSSEYVHHLISQGQLETMLLEGLDSGEPIDVTDEWWEQKRRRLTDRITKLQL